MQKTSLLGSGSFGDVWKGCNKKNNQTVAIKIVDLEEAQDEIEDIQEEILILAQCVNKHITNYYGSFLKVNYINPGNGRRS